MQLEIPKQQKGLFQPKLFYDSMNLPAQILSFRTTQSGMRVKLLSLRHSRAVLLDKASMKAGSRWVQPFLPRAMFKQTALSALACT